MSDLQHQPAFRGVDERQRANHCNRLVAYNVLDQTSSKSSRSTGRITSPRHIVLMLLLSALSGCSTLSRGWVAFDKAFRTSVSGISNKAVITPDGDSFDVVDETSITFRDPRLPLSPK